jgi:hypothetical protein
MVHWVDSARKEIAKTKVIEGKRQQSDGYGCMLVLGLKRLWCKKY